MFFCIKYSTPCWVVPEMLMPNTGVYSPAQFSEYLWFPNTFVYLIRRTSRIRCRMNSRSCCNGQIAWRYNDHKRDMISCEYRRKNAVSASRRIYIEGQRSQTKQLLAMSFTTVIFYWSNKVKRITVTVNNFDWRWLTNWQHSNVNWNTTRAVGQTLNDKRIQNSSNRQTNVRNSTIMKLGTKRWS